MRTCGGARRIPARVACSILFGLIAGPCLAGLTPVKLKIGGKEVPLKASPLYDGRDTYLPLEALRSFGAGYRMDRREVTAALTFADGGSVEVALARPSGQPMIPLSSILSKLDADCSVSHGVCEIRARVIRAGFEGGTLRISTGFPLPAAGRLDSAGSAYLLEIRGASLPPGFNVPKAPASENRVTAVKMEQTPDGVRVRLSLAPDSGAKSDSLEEGRIHIVTLVGAARASIAKAEPSKKEASSGPPPPIPMPVQSAESLDERHKGGGALAIPSKQESPASMKAVTDRKQAKAKQAETKLDLTLPPIPMQPPAQDSRTAVQKTDSVDTSGQRNGTAAIPYDEDANPNSPVPLPPVGTKPVSGIRVTDVAFQAMDRSHARIKITTAGKVNATATLITEPSRLAIDIPNTLLETEQHWPVEHPFLSGIHAIADKPGTTRILLDLSRLVAYRVLQTGSDGIAINLSLPRGTGRKLGDLILVVDPGHGGPVSTGAHVVVNGRTVYEKNITLAVATKLRALLQEAGVNVIMTRTADTDVSLTTRPGLANDNNADLFVSIHVDDCDAPNTASGSTAYYHFDDESSRALAHSIVEHVARVSGLPNRRARSDRERFATGMAVLRHCSVPATLVELGYINNATDRKKLMDEQYQQKIAQAIFDGIRAYVGGTLPEASLAPIGTR